MDDFASTATLMEQLDLIITIDTAAAHLAGALGKPTWLLLSATPIGAGCWSDRTALGIPPCDFSARPSRDWSEPWPSYARSWPDDLALGQAHSRQPFPCHALSRRNAEPEIKPRWSAAIRSHPAQHKPFHAHATRRVMVVLKTQELAGIDLISDGELSRFDVSHPQTNGMIDYFIRHGRYFIDHYPRGLGQFRRRAANGLSHPAGRSGGECRHGGNAELPRDWQFFKGLSPATTMFTFTAPYMLSSDTDRPALRRHSGVDDGHRRGAAQTGRVDRCAGDSNG